MFSSKQALGWFKVDDFLKNECDDECDNECDEKHPTLNHPID
jgi:hypothetical protein